MHIHKTSIYDRQVVSKTLKRHEAIKLIYSVSAIPSLRPVFKEEVPLVLP